MTQPASASLVAALAEASDGAIDAGTLAIVRDEATGDVIRIEGLGPQVVTLHVASDQRLVLIEVASTGQPILLRIDTNEAIPVARPAADIIEDAVDSQGTLTVQVVDKSGWIQVSVRDAHPDRPLQAVAAVNGAGAERQIPTSQLWRDGGLIHVLDDPTTAYTIRFGEAGAIPSAPTPEGHGISPFMVGGIAVAVILAGIVLTMILSGRRV